MVIVGFRSQRDLKAFQPPDGDYLWKPNPDEGKTRTMGVREALGLPKIGTDGLAPTIRCSWTGPRHTTSILNSTAAKRRWDELQIGPMESH